MSFSNLSINCCMAFLLWWVADLDHPTTYTFGETPTSLRLAAMRGRLETCGRLAIGLPLAFSGFKERRLLRLRLADMWGSQSWLQPALSRLFPRARSPGFSRNRLSRQGSFLARGNVRRVCQPPT